MTECKNASHVLHPTPGFTRLRNEAKLIWGFDYNFANYNFRKTLDALKTYLARLCELQVNDLLKFNVCF